MPPCFFQTAQTAQIPRHGAGVPGKSRLLVSPNLLASPRRKKARSLAGLEVVPKFGAIYAGSGQWRVLVGHPQRRASATARAVARPTPGSNANHTFEMVPVVSLRQFAPVVRVTPL